MDRSPHVATDMMFPLHDMTWTVSRVSDVIFGLRLNQLQHLLAPESHRPPIDCQSLIPSVRPETPIRTGGLCFLSVGK